MLSLGSPKVFLWFSCRFSSVSPQVIFRFSSGYLQVLRRFSSGSSQVLLRFSSGSSYRFSLGSKVFLVFSSIPHDSRPEFSSGSLEVRFRFFSSSPRVPRSSSCSAWVLLRFSSWFSTGSPQVLLRFFSGSSQVLSS